MKYPGGGTGKRAGKGPRKRLTTMMISDLINDIKAIETSPKKIRDFGITFFAILALIGGVFLYKGRDVGYLCVGLGLLFLLAGIFAGNSLRLPYKLWMGFAAILGFFMSRLILCVIFYLVITPTSMIMRLFGRDLLDQRWNRDAGSYWIKKDQKPLDKNRYEKLY